MHYPDSRWRPRCQGKSRDDVSGRIQTATTFGMKGTNLTYTYTYRVMGIKRLMPVRTHI